MARHSRSKSWERDSRGVVRRHSRDVVRRHSRGVVRRGTVGVWLGEAQ